MIGAIVGDFIGSEYEFHPTKDYNFKVNLSQCELTDDSIMSLAIADAILKNKSYADSMRYWGNKYPNPKGAYGGSFNCWLRSPDPKPYNSWGNGSAMRVSAIGWAFDTLEKVQKEAEKSAACTHNHPFGIKGAVAVASIIYLIRNGKSRMEVKDYIMHHFYELPCYQKVHPTYKFDESCEGTVPAAMCCYFSSESYEDAVRKAIALGGDADTLGSITGSIAEADNGYSIPVEWEKATLQGMPEPLKNILDEFNKRFCNIEK